RKPSQQSGGPTGRNTKSQTPSSRQIPSSKFQNALPRHCLGAWNLELLWCLELGFWSFDSPWTGIQGLAELVPPRNRICETVSTEESHAPAEQAQWFYGGLRGWCFRESGRQSADGHAWSWRSN